MPATSRLPPLELAIQNATLSATADALSSALGMPGEVRSLSADDKDVRFTLVGKKRFAEAFCELHVQHPIQLSFGYDAKGAAKIDMRAGPSDVSYTDCGLVLGATKVDVVTLPRQSDGGPFSSFPRAPFLGLSAFIDPRLELVAARGPKLVQLEDVDGRDILPKLAGQGPPPEDFTTNQPTSGTTFGWTKSLRLAKWTIDLRVKDDRAQGGQAELPIVVAVQNIDVPS